MVCLVSCSQTETDAQGLIAYTASDYSESFGKPCVQLLYSSATSSNEPFVCIQIISSCTS